MSVDLVVLRRKYLAVKEDGDASFTIVHFVLMKTSSRYRFSINIATTVSKKHNYVDTVFNTRSTILSHVCSIAPFAVALSDCR